MLYNLKVQYIPTDENTADLFTKVLKRQPFEKHRKVVLNSGAGESTDEVKQQRVAALSRGRRNASSMPNRNNEVRLRPANRQDTCASAAGRRGERLLIDGPRLDHGSGGAVRHSWGNVFVG